MPKVYAPQQPAKWDEPSGLWVPTADLSPAERYGELVVMFHPSSSKFGTAPLVTTTREHMQHFTIDDYVLAVGDPSLIAAAACVAVRKTGGLLRMLKWDRFARQYNLVEARP